MNLNFFQRTLALIGAIAILSMGSVVSGQTTEEKQEAKPAATESTQEKPDTKPAEKAEAKPADQKKTDEKTAEEKKKDEGKEKAPDPITIAVANNNLKFSASGTWKSVPPRSRMLEAEVKIPRVGADTEDGRLTIMGAGGSIEANINRWKNQFKQPDGSDTSAKTKTEKKMIAGQTVNMVDITGTFIDAPGGPFSGQPKVERANYRMMAAIIQTKAKGNYFVKFYGPKATVDKNAEHFKSMINGMKAVE